MKQEAPQTPPAPPPATDTPFTRFIDLALSAESLRAIQDAGYDSPTPVQAGAIPRALAGADLMVQSQTGTGKTAAFCLPLIELISANARGERGVIRALVLAPTRELARQVAEEATRLSRYHGLKVVTVYGGAPMEPQVEALRSADIVVGTPGRVVDHLKRKTLHLNALTHFILDEADEMLSMGFAEDLDEVLRRVPKARQNFLFSATFPPAVKRYAERMLRSPELLSFLTETSSADELEHRYYMIRGLTRTRELLAVIEAESPPSAIIFVNTRRECEQLAVALQRRGLDAERLSGDMDQPERERVMKRMKDKSLRFLIATDVAARGIDITQLSHVIHYQLPESTESYIHRSGRTGRAGEKGVVLSLVGAQELGVLYALKKFHHLPMQERPLPALSPTPPAQLKVAPAPIKVEPAPVKVAPAPVKVEPAPVKVAPAPVKVEHAPVKVAPAPVKVELAPVKVELAPVKVEPAPAPSLARPEPPQGEGGALNQGAQVTQGAWVSALRAHLVRVPHDFARSEAAELLGRADAFDLVRALVHASTLKVASPEAPPQAPSEALPLRAERGRARRCAVVEINVGRARCSNPGLLKARLAELAGLMPDDIMSVQCGPSSSRLELRAEFASDFVEAVQGEDFEGLSLLARLV